MRAATVVCLVCNAENPPGATVCGTCGAALRGDPATGSSSALPTGTQLKGGLYTVGRVLGQGGFGITYLGSDAAVRRPVAAKEFFPYGSLRRGTEVLPGSGLDAAEFASARGKFGEEARVLARFHHPGIVAVYDSFEENRTAYMIMEYLRGRSLGKLVEERGALPEPEAVDDIRRAGQALEVVHAANLLHRDIKPDNIVLTDDGRVVLIDFGNARTYTAGMTSRMTTLVTPGYAPLEQYGQRVRFGAFTDVYALGATLYHLLTGQMPAPATDRAGGLELPAPRQLNPDLSQKVSDAVVWALEMRVDRRPPTVRAFLDALEPPTRSVPPPRSRVAPTPPPRPAPAPASSPAAPLPRSPVSAGSPGEPLAPRPRFPPLSGNGPWEVQLRAERLRWPDGCACCFQPADSTYLAEYTGASGPFAMFTETRGWDVPYCSTCLRHLDLAASPAPGGGVGTALAGAAAGLLLGGPVGLLLGLGGGAAMAAAGTAARQAQLAAALRPTCVAVGPAIAYLGWYDDTHAFCLLNRAFAEELRRRNAANVV